MENKHPPPPYEERSRLKEIINPSLPVTEEIPDGMIKGRVIKIKGRMNDKPYRFTINLQDKTDGHSGIIHFHFDARVDWNKKNRRVVVRNHWADGLWHQEERETPYFPFQANQPFRLRITTDDTFFRVDVNENHFVNFEKRSAVKDKVPKFLKVSGDAAIEEITIE